MEKKLNKLIYINKGVECEITTINGKELNAVEYNGDIYKRPKKIQYGILNKLHGVYVGSSGYQYEFINNQLPISVEYMGKKGSAIHMDVGTIAGITITTNGTVSVDIGSGGYEGTVNHKDFIYFTFADGSIDSDTLSFQFDYYACVKEGSKVQLFDGEIKNIEDVKYNDYLLCWDFNKGEYAYSKPIWIMKKKHAKRYNKLIFSDGSILYTISQHRIFNIEKEKFTYPMTDETPIGTTCLSSCGEKVKLVSKEIITEECDYYNIMTEKNINLFVNNILTSCRLSNMYKIQNLKYIKENCSPRTTEDLSSLPLKYIEGLCLKEQPYWNELSNNADNFGNSLTEYVNHLIQEENKNA